MEGSRPASPLVGHLAPPSQTHLSCTQRLGCQGERSSPKDSRQPERIAKAIGFEVFGWSCMQLLIIPISDRCGS